MIAGHDILLLEDDENAAKRMIGALRAHGDRVTWVKTVADARRALAETSFCLIIADIEVPFDEGDIPNEQSGLTFIKHDVRSAFRGVTDSLKHKLQLLAVTGFSKEWEFVKLVMQEGASDFIAKPLPGNLELARKIDEALRHSGRDDHADCERVTREARNAPGTSSAPPPAATMPDLSRVALRVLGDTVNGRSQVLVNGEPAWLTVVVLKALLFLIVGRLRSTDGWMDRSEFGKEASAVVHALSRLRSDLGVRVDEFDKSKGYRLLSTVDVEHVDTGVLAKANKDHATIVKLAQEIERLQKKRR